MHPMFVVGPGILKRTDRGTVPAKAGACQGCASIIWAAAVASLGGRALYRTCSS